MSKVQFFEMRAEQLATMYDSKFTKKEATKAGEALIQSVLDSGEVDKYELMSNLVRLQEVISSAVTKMRAELPFENYEALGVSYTAVNGGSTVDYTQDQIYCELKAVLDARVELLKLAQKQEVLDTGGNEVPKVGTTTRKSSLTIKF